MIVYFCDMARYCPPEQVEKFVVRHSKLPFKVLGLSEENRPIYVISIGKGPIKVMLWSQMHGNESSTTRALLSFLADYAAGTDFPFLNQLQLCIIPQLNPDGAFRYQRYNANAVDLNRDAQKLTQSESQLLEQLFLSFQPDYALNLHGQRTFFAAGPSGLPATLSFLAPAADTNRSIPPHRLQAMQIIAGIAKDLELDLKGRIGRYDDSYNPNCVGDRFTTAGVPTILFEVGHYPDDYQRNIATQFVYHALLSCFQHMARQSYNKYSRHDYEALPENHKTYVDILLQDVSVLDQGKTLSHQDVAIQYLEELQDGKLLWVPTFHSYGNDLALKGHKTIKRNSKIPNTIVFIPGGIVEFLENITH